MLVDMNKWYRSLPWRPISTALAFFSVVSTAWAQAPPQSEEALIEEYFSDWYQVEVIIFKRQQSAEGEVWSKNIALSYPPRLQHLQDSLLLEAAIEAQALTEEHARLTGGAPLKTETSDNTNKALLATIKDNDLVDPLNRKLIQTMIDAEQKRIFPKEQPFILLEASERELSDEARAIERSQRLRVLFHETWRQPMKDPKHAQAIIIQGGKSYEKHKELEGSIVLGVKRYLHIQTNLWMSEFEANYGQVSEHWPALPELPVMLQMQTLSADLALSPLINAEQSGQQGIQVNLGNGTSIYNNSIDSTKPNRNLNSGWQPQLSSYRFNFGDVTSPSNLQDFSVYTEKPYVIRHITQMQQTRRMRSKELHYIDHPRMGLLVKIIKYKPKVAAKES
ncbi:MAG: hypothetical protein COA42_00715 [Alteromonadaceae bacterium]|nr:MAG: hypothetical protein COA42_00715 [Alteromonadaceae bacterium]